MADESKDQLAGDAETSLDRAANMGPLPGLAAQNAAAERGEDHSHVPEDDDHHDGVIGRVVRDLDGD